ncbi:FAD-dependent oxidoreductase [Lacrimispora sp.]|uniref:FAD-dependent oxidoreductase n=1 Tax=Lacrimispora sp. TaxID=2719234 RepID=UPI0028A95ABF|nr:FAD-dependent oxidoreductase [Lacrimispora sp.]
MTFTEFKILFKKHQGCITEVNHHFSDYYTAKVAVEKGFTWAAGEYAYFTLKDERVKGRPFRELSIASIPEDGYVLLGFRTGETPSSYKQFIIDHGVNAEISIRGPIGDFKLRDDKRPVVLFAAGVGITPIFSILKSIRSNQQREVYVVYPSSQHHLFKKEIDSIADKNPKIHLSYMHKSEEAQAKLTELAKKLGNEAYYYTAGSGRVIKSIRNLLKGLGIQKNNMLNDHFEGYK